MSNKNLMMINAEGRAMQLTEQERQERHRRSSLLHEALDSLKVEHFEEPVEEMLEEATPMRFFGAMSGHRDDSEDD